MAGLTRLLAGLAGECPGALLSRRPNQCLCRWRQLLPQKGGGWPTESLGGGGATLLVGGLFRAFKTFKAFQDLEVVSKNASKLPSSAEPDRNDVKEADDKSTMRTRESNHNWEDRNAAVQSHRIEKQSPNSWAH